MAVYTTIDNPELYFQTKLYTGTGTSTAFTLDGDEDMQPDLVWIKRRDSSDDHEIFDAVRGANETLNSNTTNAEATVTGSLTSFNSDGFTLGGDFGNVNGSSNTQVAWCWKAGGSASSNSDGSLTTSVSVNTTAGFSIVGFTLGSGTGSSTQGHGLGAVPHLILHKSRAQAYNWSVYHHKNTAAPETDTLKLNTTAATDDQNLVWNDTAPTSTVYTHGNNSWNGAGTAISYVWIEKQGFSKFSSFIGNGSSDGTFVYTGFRPAFLMVKATSATSAWYIYDNKRAGYNPDNNQLYPDRNNTEDTTDQVDLLSNGFKWQGITGDPNSSGRTYVYMAFAEAPFVNSNGVPGNAR